MKNDKNSKNLNISFRLYQLTPLRETASAKVIPFCDLTQGFVFILKPSFWGLPTYITTSTNKNKTNSTCTVKCHRFVVHLFLY